MALIDLEITGDEQNFTATFQQIKIINNNRTIVRVDGLGNGAKKKKRVCRSWSCTTARPGSLRATVTMPLGIRRRVATSTRPKKASRVDRRVPDTDLNEGLQNGGLGAKQNSTYFDQESDEWRNSDGTSVTQSQLNAKECNVSRGTAPWWQGLGPSDDSALEQVTLGPIFHLLH
jgi:hypothetical protein